MGKRYRNIDGLDVVQRVFTAMPEENAKEVTIALNKGGDEIADRARLLVPRRAGDLANSIEVRRSEIKARKDNKAAFVTVVAGTDPRTASYARVIEFGRYPGPDNHPGFAGRDFFFSSYWSLRDRVKGRVQRAIRRAAKAMAAIGNA